MFDIISNPETGVHVASDPDTGRRVMVQADSGRGRLFKRHAVKNYPDGRTEEVEWLVAELDGVRTYFDGDAVVVSRRELYP